MPQFIKPLYENKKTCYNGEKSLEREIMIKPGIPMKKYLRYMTAVLIMAVVFTSAFPITVLADGEITMMELSATGEITSDVNVRKGPGTDYEKIGTLRTGDIVTVTGESHDGWYRIEFQGAEGFVYGQYMTIVSATDIGTDSAENAQEQQDALEEPEQGTHAGINIFKTAAIVVIIVVIIVMIILTLKSMRHDDGSDEEEDDDAEDYDEDEEDDGAEDFDENEEDDEEVPDIRSEKVGKPKPIVIREEDYQLHIDPKYFEDEPIAQPDCVTGYLQKKQQEEEEQKAKENLENSGDLQRAMDKLQELQEEIEKLKKKRE